jgi:hypothetical protein
VTIPVPQSLPPAVSLWVDGVRFADGQPGEPDTLPVALTDLAVTWGRQSTVDQPTPASLSFVVMDVGGGERFTSRLHMGARVLVRADAVIYPAPSVSVVVDPGFEAAAVGSAPSTVSSNAGVAVTAARAATGAHSARVRPVDPSRGVRVVFPPAPLTPDDPSGWDAIPRTQPGQSWGYGAAVWVPEYLAAVARVTVRPAWFPRPWGPPTVVDEPAAGGPPAAGWVTFAGTVNPPADVWVGVVLDVYPTGPAWLDVPGSTTWAGLSTPVPSWLDLADVYVDDLSVLAPDAGAARAGSVFDGRITDMVARYDIDRGATIVDVIAQDDTAELANRYVGTTPWAAEPLSARFGKIVTASGQVVTYVVDAGPGALQVTYRDVDAQPALTLLQELAESANGVLWAASSIGTGPFLRLEDIGARPALQKLIRGADLVVVIVPADIVGTSGITVSACDVLLDPVRWEIDSTDSATRIDVGWLEQVVDAGVTKPAARTVTLVDTAAETATGRRRVGVQTQLTTSANASTVGAAMLARLTAGGWRVGGLTWRAEIDDPLTPAGIAAVMQVLDGSTRLGLPIMLTDLPDWSPIPAGTDVPLFLEGGRFANVDGAWQLDLVTSSAKAQGAGVKWQEIPAAWTWQQFSPDITWNDLYGVRV